MGEADKKAMEKKIEEGKKAEMNALKKQRKEELKKQKVSFFTDFKKFITKGNVLDMAVGVVVGSAFSAIVNGLVKMIINPCIALIPGAESMDNWKTILKAAELDTEGAVVKAEVAILWGQWIQTIIQFIIIALSIFIALRIIRSAGKKLRARELEAQRIAEEKKKAEEKEKADAAAAAAAAKEAQIQEFYANVARQTELLEQLSKK